MIFDISKLTLDNLNKYSEINNYGRCVVCGEELRKRKKSKTCSNKCYQTLYKRKMRKNIICEKEVRKC